MCVCTHVCTYVFYVKTSQLERHSSVIPHSTTFLIKEHGKIQLIYFYLKRNCENQGSHVRQTNTLEIIFQ